MKKIIIALSVMMLAGVMPCASQYSRGYTRHYGRQNTYSDVVELLVREPGTLNERMPKDLVDRVRVLRIEGSLNEADLKYITKLAKRSKVVDERGKDIDNFLDLDLERARVQEKSLLGTNRDVLANRAFEYATHLRSVVLPERLKSIGSSAFASCYNLEEVVMPTQVMELGDYAFEGCSQLRYFTMPTSLETIGRQCFKGCESLRQIQLPSMLRYIGKEAFHNCGVTELRIPSYCEIEEGGLGQMGQLQTIEVDRGNEHFSSIEHALYDRDGRTLLLYPAGRTGDCRLPSGMEAIDTKAFYKSKVSAIDVPTSVTWVGESAFEGCEKLTSIWLPDGVVELPAKLFCDCTSLREIEMGAISKMGEKAFYNCQSLQSLTLGGSLSSVPASAFEYCKKLSQVNLPDGVTSIGEKAFHECNALQTINFSNRLTKIGKQAFDRCYALESITLPDGLTVIEEKLFFECKALRSVTLGSNVKSIGKEAFRRCKELSHVELPTSLRSIDKEAFRECSALRQLALKEGLETLGENALRETAIEVLDMPSTMRHVGKKVAEKCKSLQHIVCRATTPPELDAVSNDKVELSVPAAAIDAYRNAKNWKKFKTIIPIQ